MLIVGTPEWMLVSKTPEVMKASKTPWRHPTRPPETQATQGRRQREKQKQTKTKNKKIPKIKLTYPTKINSTLASQPIITTKHRWLKWSKGTQTAIAREIWHHQNPAMILQQAMDMLTQVKQNKMTLSQTLWGWKRPLKRINTGK